jgi:alkaline phosphatase
MLKRFFRKFCLNQTFLVFVLMFLSFSLFAKSKIQSLRDTYKGPKAKYVFYFIGDGMGLSHINATEAYRAALEGKIGRKNLSFTDFSNICLTSTHALNRYVTDSAAAGTALATGNKTSVGTISMDLHGKKKFKSIASMAKEKGMKVGIISTVNINDATPSVFYAHNPNRRMSKEIAEDLLKSDFDLFAGGGLKKIKDYKSFLSKAGYIFIDNKKDFKKLKFNSSTNKKEKPSSKYYLACPIRDSSEACRYSVDMGSDEIRLSEFTKKATELLKGPEGFFLMIEGGKIDWAAHSNDALSVMKDIVEFDDAIKEAVKFYKKHPEETAIVVVADHETGGFGLGHTPTEYETYFTKLRHQKISLQELDNKIVQYISKTPKEKIRLEGLLVLIKKYTGLGDASKGLALNESDILELQKAFDLSIEGKNDNALYPKYSKPLSSKVISLLSEKAGLGWTTFYHTGVPVIAFAEGVGSELCTGIIDNTDMPKNLKLIMDL